MFNSHTKCNFSASSIMTDIQRLQLKYERGLRCMYNGMSLRGVIVGIKKKTGQEEEPPEKAEPAKKVAKKYDLDYGLDMEPEVNEPEIVNDHNTEYTENLPRR